jgi:uncharacterized protein (TIGR02466 family)
MNKYIKNIFSTGILIFNVSGLDNKNIINYSEKNSLKNKNKDSKNILKEPLFEELNNIVLDKMNEYYYQNYSENFNVFLKEAWANVNNDELITFPHNHKECFLSAVYYASSTDGQIVFLNPMQSLLNRQSNDMINEYNEYNSEYFRLNVKTGDMIIFNSMLYHFIIPSKEKRISIAYNGDVKSKTVKEVI